jgi:hypothetical protein
VRLYILCIIALCGYLSLAENVRADDIRLFGENSSLTKNYDSEIEKLKKLPKNHILEFTDQNGNQFKFKLVSFLGQGQTTAIFRATPLAAGGFHEDVALRLPIGRYVLGDDEKIPAQPYLNQTLEAYYVLRAGGLEIPEISSYVRNQFIAGELVQHDFNGIDFFVHPERIDPKVLQEADQALEQFAKTTVKFETIGDFEPGQLVYNIREKRWTLLDYRSFTTHKAAFLTRKTVFDDVWFRRGLTDARNQDPRINPPLTTREKDLVSRLSLAVRKERSFVYKAQCLATYLAGSH